jgi:hypothetical protein
MAYGLEDSIDAVAAGKIADSDGPLEFATSQALGLASGASERDVADMKTKLDALQNQRQRQRGAEVKAAPARSPATARPAAESAFKSPVKAARAFADAIAHADKKSALQLVHAQTNAERQLAAANVDVYVNEARFRTAAVKQLGREQALRLPRIDAGTEFVDRFKGETRGDRAVVRWNDDCASPEQPAGSVHSLAFVRDSDGGWRVDPLTFDLEPAQDQTAADIYENAQAQKDYARRLDRIIADVESGRLKTFDEISKAH